jgi:antitoxin PrlF
MTKENGMSSQVVRVQEKGQVTIPFEIRQKLNLKKGDLVIFIETDEGILIKPVEVLVASTLDEIGRALKERGIALEELLESARQTRGELINEEYQLSEHKSK